jgi:hypothetical protein
VPALSLHKGNGTCCNIHPGLSTNLINDSARGVKFAGTVTTGKITTNTPAPCRMQPAVYTKRYCLQKAVLTLSAPPRTRPETQENSFINGFTSYLNGLQSGGHKRTHRGRLERKTQRLKYSNRTSIRYNKVGPGFTNTRNRTVLLQCPVTCLSRELLLLYHHYYYYIYFN